MDPLAYGVPSGVTPMNLGGMNFVKVIFFQKRKIKRSHLFGSNGLDIIKTIKFNRFDANLIVPVPDATPP